MKPRQLFLFVEGEGDKQAAPILLKRLLKERGAHDVLVVAPDPWMVGEFPLLRRSNFSEWRRHLNTAIRKYGMEACLLLIDGDSPPSGGETFCVKRAAQQLAAIAKERGAGDLFSASIVIANLEFESWLIAGASSLAGKTLSNGAGSFSKDLKLPTGDIELAPRDAKGFFDRALSCGYRPALHQASITELVDLDTIRQQDMRSFRRLENAIDEMIDAFRGNRHIVSPVSKP